MLNTRFHSWPSYTEEEAEAVRRVLLSNRVNYWTGTECREFEVEFAAWCGARHAVALANGTLALDAALRALRIGPGDEVVVTPRTFMASVSCVANTGAIPVFADVDADSGNVDGQSIARALTARTRAVICVHLAGWPCEMDSIMALATKHDLKIVEDCAQAHGARYNGRSVGTFGDVAAWSFCQDKVMTTGGEGGMATTDDPKLWRAMWSLKDHGKDFSAVYERQHPPGFRWLHESFGSNWRMLEMQAAIGRIQLRRMADWCRQRGNYLRAIWDTCRRVGCLRVPEFYPRRDQTQFVHAGYRCYVYVRPERLQDGWSRERIAEEINALGVPCYQGSCSEVYLEKAFDGTGWRPQERLRVAKGLGETSLAFLVHPTLTESEIGETCIAIRRVCERASR
jgi:dTDP-4-amino-4,6-dideoxygalactose transaminase